MPTFKRTLLATAVALGLAAAGSASAQFSNLYFFGDSLTDAGYFGGARFTVNPGLVWAQDLGAAHGFTIVPSNAGGTDYAQGGARIALPGNVVTGFPQRPVTVQVDELLRATPNLDPNALYTVWIGANDVRQTLFDVGTGAIPSASAAGNVILAATQTAAQLARLRAAGARYIVVANLPDVGRTPEAAASGAAAAAGGTQLATTYNLILNGAVNQLGFPVIQVNIFALFNEILASPAAYGFTNTTGVACTTPSALTCTTATLVSPNAATTYLFADSIHPTPAGHAIIAQVVNSIITAPQQMAVLAEAPLAVEQANWRTLDGRMISAINAPRGQGKLEAWAAYDYGNPDYSGGFFSGDGNVHTVSVGADIKATERLLVGMQVGYSENKGDVGITGYRVNDLMGTVYVGYGDGPWYVGATAGAGDLDFDTSRDITLGAATRTERAETRGRQLVGRVLGGYWFNAGAWIHGPTVRITYQDVKVNEFQERGTNSTTMAFGEQRRKSLVTSAGWQVSGQTAGFRPFGRVTWEYESKNDLRSVSASTYGMGGGFSLPAYQPDDSYALFNLGVSREFANVTGFVTGSGTAGKGDGNYYGVTVGVRMPL